MQAQVGSIEGATFAEVVTVVRGAVSFTFPRDELGDLQRLLGLLGQVMPLPSDMEPNAPPVEPAPMAVEPVLAALEPHSEAKLREMWDVIKGVLAEHPNAVGEAVLVKAVRKAGYTGENVTTRVRMVLSRRGKVGLVETTVKGRFRLAKA